MNTRPVLVLCETCQGEGKLYREGISRQWDIEPRIECIGTCPDCNGTAYALVDSERVTLEDLEDAHG